MVLRDPVTCSPPLGKTGTQGTVRLVADGCHKQEGGAGVRTVRLR